MKLFSILLILICFFSLITNSSAFKYEGKKIKKIIIKGVINTSESDVKNAITLKEGDPLRASEISISIRNIYMIGKYSDIKVDAVEKEDGIIMTLIVEERAVLKTIEFKGNDEIGETDLNEAIKDIISEDKVLDESKINEAVNRILSKYREE